MRRAVRPLLAVLAALALNLVLASVIALLNRPTDRPLDAQASELLRLEDVAAPEERATEPDPVVAQDELEALAVELDAPLPELPPIALDPFVPDLALPSLPQPVVSVSVATRTRIPGDAAADPGATVPARALASEAVDEPPRELASNPQPTFPAAALRRRMTGEVELELLIDEEGRVVERRVLRGESVFVEAVLEVIDDWRFTPAHHGGRPVRVRGHKTFSFELPPR